MAIRASLLALMFFALVAWEQGWVVVGIVYAALTAAWED